MATHDFNRECDQIRRAKEELASLKDSNLPSSQSYEMIDKILDLNLVDIHIKKMYSKK